MSRIYLIGRTKREQSEKNNNNNVILGPLDNNKRSHICIMIVPERVEKERGLLK